MVMCVTPEHGDEIVDAALRLVRFEVEASRFGRIISCQLRGLEQPDHQRFHRRFILAQQTSAHCDDAARAIGEIAVEIIGNLNEVTAFQKTPGVGLPMGQRLRLPFSTRPEARKYANQPLSRSIPACASRTEKISLQGWRDR